MLGMAAEIVPSGWFYSGEMTMAQFFQPSLQAINGKTIRLVSVAAHRAESRKGCEQQYRSRYNMAALMVCPCFGRLAGKFIEVHSSIDLARVACALERYRLAHNEYPENLDALAPPFIAAIPLAVINGQPLHYRRTAGGNFVLYSVGWNEDDDGGIPGANKDGFNDFRPGDWVWQYPQSWSAIAPVQIPGEHNRPGCGSARPRAERTRARKHQPVGKFPASEGGARARPPAPGAGALPKPTAWLRPSSADNFGLTSCSPTWWPPA